MSHEQKDVPDRCGCLEMQQGTIYVDSVSNSPKLLVRRCLLVQIESTSFCFPGFTAQHPGRHSIRNLTHHLTAWKTTTTVSLEVPISHHIIAILVSSFAHPFEEWSSLMSIQQSQACPGRCTGQMPSRSQVFRGGPVS